jgi:hypothetical protein
MNNQYSFENFIMQCCKAREWDLRRFLKRTLLRAGFKVIEDNYTSSHRGGKYSGIHNMLFTRGENPLTCLVAHTDVCRDHVANDYNPPLVDPVVKNVSIDGEERRIIQSRFADVQVGGDDRLGVAINVWIALNTGYDMGLLFTTDEEVGAVSADELRFSELMDFEILLQVDRGNRNGQLVTSIGGLQLCDSQTAKRLIKISENIGLPRYEVDGMLTDVLVIKGNDMCKNAVNMTCGYWNSIGAQKNEFIDIQEAKETMQYVSSIIQYYDLGEIDNEEIEDDIGLENLSMRLFEESAYISGEEDVADEWKNFMG